MGIQPRYLLVHRCGHHFVTGRALLSGDEVLLRRTTEGTAVRMKSDHVKSAHQTDVLLAFHVGLLHRRHEFRWAFRNFQIIIKASRDEWGEVTISTRETWYFSVQSHSLPPSFRIRSMIGKKSLTVDFKIQVLFACHAELGSASHFSDPFGEIPDQVRDDRSIFQKHILDKSDFS